jgi:hypothetical protein
VFTAQQQPKIESNRKEDWRVPRPFRERCQVHETKGAQGFSALLVSEVPNNRLLINWMRNA